MHLDLTPEALLAQLGYTRNEQTLEQMNKIIENTKDFAKFSHHIPSFNDVLAVEKGFTFVDCQIPTDHLLSLGAICVERELFLEMLEDSAQYETLLGSWALARPKIPS